MKLHISISLVGPKGKGKAKKNYIVVNAKPTARTLIRQPWTSVCHGTVQDSRAHFYDANDFPPPRQKKNMPLYQIQEASAKLLSSFSYHVLNQKPPSDREFQRANTALNVLVRGHL